MQYLVKRRDVEVIIDDGVSGEMRDHLTGLLVSALAGRGRRLRAAVCCEGGRFIVSIDLREWGVPAKLVLPAQEGLTVVEVVQRLERATRRVAPALAQPTNL